MLFSAKFWAAFLIPHPFWQHTLSALLLARFSLCQTSLWRAAALGCAFFCTGVSYQKLLLAFLWLSQGLLEECQLLVTNRNSHWEQEHPAPSHSKQNVVRDGRKSHFHPHFQNLFPCSHSTQLLKYFPQSLFTLFSLNELRAIHSNSSLLAHALTIQYS